MSDHGVLNFDPMKSFGEGVADTYNENVRGDEAETIASADPRRPGPVLGERGPTLSEDGLSLIEAAVPGPLYRLDDHYVAAEAVELTKITLDVGRYDRVTQLLDECHITLTREGIRIAPIVTRFVWASEMDLMARIDDHVVTSGSTQADVAGQEWTVEGFGEGNRSGVVRRHVSPQLKRSAAQAVPRRPSLDREICKVGEGVCRPGESQYTAKGHAPEC